ncbi:MAG: N-glycosylase/DNA lyase [Candidatus Muirbacterium halophilum]|nr:N-glycosylase/DNA lyase [Candidatus Muirbacterium halophilum]MCK9474832.1 N-glycosylase/DNA lyase [Candidatus Muirbacterium halophilum]
MTYNKFEVERIKNIYNNIKPDIINRISEFENIFKLGSEEDIITELIFCVFTPQSKARKCWEAVCDLKNNNVLFTGKPQDILPYINSVRFKNRKSEYAYIARSFFTDNNGLFNIKKTLLGFDDKRELRNYLAENIKGYGYKEASHFLRNIGFGKNLAILDRHILKNLVKLNIIDEIPKSISKKKYSEIELKIEKFCNKINIRMDYLDLVLWYSEAGEIFK